MLLRTLDLQAPDILICDLNLAATELLGYEIATHLRKQGWQGFFVLYSDSIEPDISKKALESGANQFIPKPLSDRQLLGIFMSYLHKTKAFTQKDRLTIALIEDNPLILDSWGAKLADHTVFSLESPDELPHLVPEKLTAIDLVITDLHFENSNLTGIKALESIRNLLKCKIILSTNAALVGDYDQSLFDFQTSKSLDTIEPVLTAILEEKLKWNVP